jgi:2-dehydro-3-deoxyphosphooctonate aldolase (KDO 8-P synthase)
MNYVRQPIQLFQSLLNVFLKYNMIVIAGPCLAESKEVVEEVSERLAEITKKLPVTFFFKASYKKANRTSGTSFQGIGDEEALSLLANVRNKLNVPVLTDIHEVKDVEIVSPFVDVLQIPAFLCRQTELLIAAGKANKIVNIKKGQFLAPEAMKYAVEKVQSGGNSTTWVTERGTTFGYHDLVVDFRSLVVMKELNVPVIYDATHSVQTPSISNQSGGNPQYIRALARAATAVGIDGIFFETHPNPAKAKSDAATQMPLTAVESFLTEIVELHSYANKFS